MTTRSRKSDTKRTATSHSAAGAGREAAGAEFDPAQPADEQKRSERLKSVAMPAPGIPMSEADYEKLKRKAQTARKTSKHGQEDPAVKK